MLYQKGNKMEKNQKDLVVVITHGPNEELASAAVTIANGGITSGLNVSIFLTGAGVEIIRKKATDLVQVLPLDPLNVLLEDFVKRGANLWACAPCLKSRGLEEDDLIEGSIITGSSVMHNLIKDGAATLSF